MPIRVEYGTVTLTVTGLPRVFCNRSPPPADPATEPAADPAAAELSVLTAPQQHRPGPSRAEPCAESCPVSWRWAELSPASGWADGLDASVPVVVLSLWVQVLVSAFVPRLVGAGAPMWPWARALQPMAASASARRLSMLRPSSGSAVLAAAAAASIAVINAAKSSTGTSAPKVPMPSRPGWAHTRRPARARAFAEERRGGKAWTCTSWWAPEAASMHEQ